MLVVDLVYFCCGGLCPEYLLCFFMLFIRRFISVRKHRGVRYVRKWTYCIRVKRKNCSTEIQQKKKELKWKKPSKSKNKRKAWVTLSAPISEAPTRSAQKWLKRDWTPESQTSMFNTSAMVTQSIVSFSAYLHRRKKTNPKRFRGSIVFSICE